MTTPKRDLELRIDKAYFRYLSSKGDEWAHALEEDLKKNENGIIYVGSPSADVGGLYSDVRSMVARFALDYHYTVIPADKTDIPIYGRLWMKHMETVDDHGIRYKYA